MAEPEENLTPEDQMIAEALQARRPSPTPTFRGALGRRLTSLDPGYGHRPARLWSTAGLLSGVGALILLVGLLVSTGAI